MRKKTKRCQSTAIVVFASLSCLAVSVGASKGDANGALWDSSWSKGLLDEEEMAPKPAKTKTKTKPVDRKPTPNPKPKQPIAEDEPWKQKEDWWKDPLAMFDDDDEYIGDKQSKKEAPEAAALLEMQKKEEQHAQKKAKEQADKKAKEAQTKNAKEEKAALEKEASQRAAERAAEKEKAAKERAAEKSAAKQKREEDKAAKQRAKQERKAQREQEMEFEKAMRLTSPPRKRLSLNPSQFALSIPALKAAIARVPFLSSPGPAFGLFASVILGKIIIDKIRGKSTQDEPTSEPFLEDLSDYPAALARQQQQDTMHFQLDEMRYSDAYSEENTETDASDAIDAEGDVDNNYSPPDSFERDQIASIGTYSNPSSPAFLKGIRSKLVGGHSRSMVTSNVAVSGGRRVKVTANELEYLKTVADQAVTQRQAMEQEYEKTSFQLQQAQSEVSQLASTTKYLKSQLKDYEEMMDRTIRNERKRAKVEIQKMKEIMEASIEQDRESLRRQFTHELERLQAQYENERAKREEEILQGLGEDEEYDEHDEAEGEDHHASGMDSLALSQDNSTVVDSDYPPEEGIYAKKSSSKSRRRSRRNKK